MNIKAALISYLVLIGLPAIAVAEENTGTEAGEVKAESSEMTADEIRDCTRKNFPTQTSVQTLVLTAYDRSGGDRSLRAKMHWRIDKDGFSNVMIRVSSPRDLSGSSYLVLERDERDDMFMYLPAVNRSKRIVGSMKTQPLWGTDLSYEDVKQLQGAALGGAVTRLDDDKVAEREVYRIQTVYDAAEESAYARVVSHIDKGICMPLRVDFFDSSDVAIKQLNINPETMVEIDGRWQIKDADMKDLHNKTNTTIQIEEIQVDETVSGRVFSQHTYYQ